MKALPLASAALAAAIVTITIPTSADAITQQQAVNRCKRVITDNYGVSAFRQMRVRDHGRDRYEVFGKVHRRGKKDYGFTCKVNKGRVTGYHYEGARGEGGNKGVDGGTAAAIGAGVVGLAILGAIANSANESDNRSQTSTSQGGQSGSGGSTWSNPDSQGSQGGTYGQGGTYDQGTYGQSGGTYDQGTYGQSGSQGGTYGQGTYDQQQAYADPFSDFNYLERTCSRELAASINRERGGVSEVRISRSRLAGRDLTGEGDIVWTNGYANRVTFTCKFDAEAKVYDGEYQYF